MIDETKREYGQFFTTVNPFNIDIFYKWMKLFINDEIELLEPFAGSCNICNMIKDLGYDNNWKCYDIDPVPEERSDGYDVEVRDTIKDFPKGFTAAITNPPYLYKASAKRRGISLKVKYDDLYKDSLDVMLNNLDYVAAIIPESFITANLFHDRLYAVVSLTCKMFADTECPVCLALFVPKEEKINLELEENDFLLYRQNELLNSFNNIKNNLIISSYNKINWKMNDKKGTVGIKCADNTKENSIIFVRGETIDENKIKVSSRSITRVSGLPDDIDLDLFIETCNNVLEEYRAETFDIFLTSFKGLREDSLYRRRLDFKTAKNIMNIAMEIIENKETERDEEE